MSRCRVLGVLLSLGLSLANVSGAELISVDAGEPDLQAVLDRANPGDVVELGPGIFAGPIRVETALILRGHGATVDGGGAGTVLTVAAPGARIEGLTVRNSGSDVGASDACIFVEKVATGATLRGNHLLDCAFGIWVHETDGGQLLDNQISGRAGVRTTDRGNGIHLFDASNLAVLRNIVEQSRDGIYVSATEDSLIVGNTVSGVRFGIHYMYSYRNEIRDNVANHNIVGIALMGSRTLIVEGNQAARNQRNGLLFRDVQDSTIRGNRLEGNGTGLFFFSSTENIIEDNYIIDNEVGMKVWAGSRRNRVAGNVLRGNRQQVFYVSAADQVWGADGRGNRWGDYLGWDQDGDGIGDRPHRVDSFTAGLLYRYPAATLLLRSPALEMLAHVADRLPMLRTPTVVDPFPIFGEKPQ